MSNTFYQKVEPFASIHLVWSEYLFGHLGTAGNTTYLLCFPPGSLYIDVAGQHVKPSPMHTGWHLNNWWIEVDIHRTYRASFWVFSSSMPTLSAFSAKSGSLKWLNQFFFLNLCYKKLSAVAVNDADESWERVQTQLSCTLQQKLLVKASFGPPKVALSTTGGRAFKGPHLPQAPLSPHLLPPAWTSRSIA